MRVGLPIVLALCTACLVSFAAAQNSVVEEATALSSTLTLPNLPSEVINGIVDSTNKIEKTASGFVPFLHGEAKAPANNGISLTLNVTEVKNGDYVGVVLSGVTNPTTYDAVAVYVQDPSDSTVGLNKLLKYKWANADLSYVKTGNTTFSFRVINQRKPLVFYFFQNATQDNGFFAAATLAAQSQPLPFSNYNEPTQAHLALTGKTGEVLVQWSTRDAGSPIVLYGTSPGHFLQVAVGSSTTYKATDMCASPANDTGFFDPGALNYVKVTGLQPSTRYYYIYGDLKRGMGSELTFMTSPAPGPSGTLKLLAIADHGHAEMDGSFEYEYTQQPTNAALPLANPQNFGPTYTAQELQALVYNVLTQDNSQQGSALATLQKLVADSADRTLFLLNGDVTYARGETEAWDTYMDAMTAIGGIVPWMLVEGNHERDSPFTGDRYNNSAADSGGECGVPYARRTQSVGNPNWIPSSPSWYSYNQGPVHFLAYSTEIDFSPGSAQYQFIESDLASVDRSVTPWIVLNGHRPIYTTSVGDSVVSVAQDLRNALEPLLLKYQVDLSWHGHDHVYERTCPIYNGTCQSNLADGSLGGPTHVVIGNAGFSLSYLPNYALPPYWRSVAVEHGYQPCTVTATAFSCQMISSIDGTVLDSFTLTKPAGFKPDLAGRTAFLANFKQTYFPGQNYPAQLRYIEQTGIPALGTLSVFAAIQASLTNPAIIAQLAQVRDALLVSTDGPDTVVTIATATKPFIPVLQSLATTPCTTPQSCAAQFYAATAYLPLFQQLDNAAAAYATKHGVLYP